MLLAASIGGWTASPHGIASIQHYEFARDFFGETYGVQVFGIVFGFLCVARLNICYSRYWEGVTQVKMMHSKWSDAAAQAVAFDRVQDHSLTLDHEPFCHHLIHLFSQLSAMATMSLHVNKAGQCGGPSSPAARCPVSPAARVLDASKTALWCSCAHVPVAARLPAASARVLRILCCCIPHPNRLARRIGFN